MITGSKIVLQLKTFLPVYSDLFTDFFIIESASTAANLVNVNSLNHGLSVGQSIIVSGGTVRNPLVTAKLVEDMALFTTEFDHDFIMPSQSLDKKELTLNAFSNPAWNITYNIMGIPNRRNFLVNLPPGETAVPPVDGSQYVIEDLEFGPKGVREVTAVPDTDNFTFNVLGVPAIPPGPVDNLKIVSGFRISAASNFERAQAIYTKQEKPYLFVIMSDVEVSRDRNTLNDSVAGFTRQNLMLLRYLQNFSTAVFLPTTDDLSGVKAQDLAYDTIYKQLLHTIYGFRDEDGSPIPYGAVPVGSGAAEYNSAYYAHVYDWQLMTSTTYQDSFLEQPNVAFRDIFQEINLHGDPEAKMILGINLDREEI